MDQTPPHRAERTATPLPRRSEHPAGAARSDAGDPASGAPTDVVALAAVIASITGVGVALSLSLPLLSVVLEGRGVSPLMIGLNTAISGVAAIAALPFATGLAKRFGTAKVIVASFCVMAPTLTAFYAVHQFALWFPLRFVFSAAVTIVFALTEFWINSLAPAARRGFVVGIYTASLSTGIALGPLILALVGTVGVLPFLIGTGCLVLAALPVAVVHAREPALATAGSMNLLPFVFAAPLAMFAALVFGAVESGGAAILPLYGTAIGLSPAQSVVLVTAIAAGNVLSQVPIGWLADRVDKRVLLLGSAALGACGALVIALVAQHFVLLMVVLFVTGGIVTGLYTIGLTELGTRYTGANLASANAAFVMMYAVGTLIGPLSLGAGLELYPPHGLPLSIAAIFALYVAVAAAGTARRGERRLDRPRRAPHREGLSQNRGAPPLVGEPAPEAPRWRRP